MGHFNFDNLVQIDKSQDVREFPPITKPTRSFCRECNIGKQFRVNFKTKGYYTTKPLKLIHTDLYGPNQIKLLHGYYYFIFFADYLTRMTWISFLKKKSEAFKNFKAFKELVENEIDLKIKFLQYNNGGEFTSNEFGIFYEEHGIKRYFLVERGPQHNGVAERKNYIVQEMERTMLKGAKLFEIFWNEGVHIFVYILNRGMIRT